MVIKTYCFYIHQEQVNIKNKTTMHKERIQVLSLQKGKFSRSHDQYQKHIYIYKHMKIINIYLHLEENWKSDQGFITHTKWFSFAVHNYINLIDWIPSMFVYLICSLPLYNHSRAHTAPSLLLISVIIFYGLRVSDYI